MSAVGRPPAVVALAGLEPLGRAGLLADVEAIRELGARPVGIATALTAQGRRRFAVSPAPAALVALQLQIAQREVRPRALKLGMVPDRAVLWAISRAADRSVPWVIDPVVRSSRGGALSKLSPRDYRLLAAPNAILTPNLVELAWLTGRDALAGEAELLDAMRELRGWGFGAVLAKGGHARGGALDLLLAGSGLHRFPASRMRRLGARGTGCRLASALAACLARGLPLEVAAARAKAYVRRYLRASA